MKVTNRRVNQCLEMSNQVNENMHPKSAAAQYLADRRQLMVNTVELLAYVTAIVGKRLRRSTEASLFGLDRTEDECLNVSRVGRLNLRYEV